MINFIVCDNEKRITDEVKKILTKIAFQTNVEYKIHIFNSYDDKFMKLVDQKLENKVYVLDIETNDKSGLEVSKHIRETDWDSVIIILTAHYELETLAYKSKLLLLDFISKFDLYEQKIYDAIKICIENKLLQDKLKIKVKRKIERICYKDILYITYDSYNRKSKIVTISKTYEVNESLKNLKQRLKGEFIYTHKACIVNINNVKTIDKKERLIIFSNDDKIDLLSRKYLKEVNEYVIN